MNVDGRLEVLEIPEAAGHAFDLLNLTVQALTHGVGHWVLEIRQDVRDMSVNRLGRLAHRE